MMRLDERIYDTLENCGFNTNKIQQQGALFYMEINQFTQLGEDWWETIWFDGTNDGFVVSLREKYNNFDVDEETEIWIEGRGKNGVPSSIKALVEDAEWKKEILGELYYALSELQFDEE